MRHTPAVRIKGLYERKFHRKMSLALWNVPHVKNPGRRSMFNKSDGIGLWVPKKLTWRHPYFLQLRHSRHRLSFRRVQSENCGSQDTQNAPHPSLSQRTASMSSCRLEMWLCEGLTKNVRLSFKKNLLRTAQTTIVIAPSGVIRSASVKATYTTQRRELACSPKIMLNRSPNATKLQISPTIIMLMPTHHNQFFRYACPSPATLPDLAVAARSPFFFTTKL